MQLAYLTVNVFCVTVFEFLRLANLIYSSI